MEEERIYHEKVFDKKVSTALIYFTVFYVIYVLLMLYHQNFQAFAVIVLAGAIIFGYIYFMRPYKYVIKRRTLKICKRIGRDKEINIMNCETVCDPIPKMTKIIIDPKALELYLEGGKRIVIYPKDIMGICEALIKVNKRMHCQVKLYNEHHKVEKKRRRETKKLSK